MKTTAITRDPMRAPATMRDTIAYRKGTLGWIVTPGVTMKSSMAHAEKTPHSPPPRRRGWSRLFQRDQVPAPVLPRDQGVAPLYTTDPSVSSLPRDMDSGVRFVSHPTGTGVQVISSEPLGVPRISLQNHHYMAAASRGTQLGSLQYGIDDSITASVTAFVDGKWSIGKTEGVRGKPTGLMVSLTPHDGETARYPALTLRADGGVALGGGPGALKSPLVSLGVFRPGVLRLPCVKTVEELEGSRSPDEEVPSLLGCLTYVTSIGRYVVSMPDGTWRALVTEAL